MKSDGRVYWYRVTAVYGRYAASIFRVVQFFWDCTVTS
jgi:hypothetical protein